jgi:trimethylamine--corrinoid protein Co-methyltransferase
VTERVVRVRSRVPWRVMSDGDLERIDDAILWTLGEVGVAFPSAKALRILRENGGRVDEATGVVRLPREVVRRALSWAGRDPACDLRLDLEHSYLSNDASGVEVIDPRSGEVRASTLADVAESARFVDALPELAYYWGPAVAAGDATLASRSAHESAAVLANTSKHYQAVTTVGEKPTRYLVELAAAVAGGKEELRKRPIVSLIQCPVDPLGNDGVALEAGLVAAECGIPCGFLSLTLGCGTAPATMAGNLVVNMAAVIADLVLLELANPGTPVFMGSAPSLMDLRTGGYTGGSPEDYLLAAAAAQLAHHYGLPIAVGTMATGSKAPDWQAAVDDALSTMASLANGADMLNGAGLLSGSKTLSYPHMVMETEIYGMVSRCVEGIAVDEETLALDVIAKVGPNGTYLAEKHTRAHMRRLWRPRVWDRSSYEHRIALGRAGAFERAREVADDVLATHRPNPLPQDLAAELAAIVARADAELAEAARA